MAAQGGPNMFTQGFGNFMKTAIEQQITNLKNDIQVYLTSNPEMNNGTNHLQEMYDELDSLESVLVNFGDANDYIEDEEQHQNIRLFSKKNKIAIDTDFLLELDKLPAIKYDLN